MGACTLEFRVASVAEVDAQDRPVTDATVTTRLVRTGAVVVPTSFIDLLPGSYVILDDGAVSLIQGREAFRVTVTRPGGASVEAVFLFEAPGGCHIEKVAGPDTLLVR